LLALHLPPLFFSFPDSHWQRKMHSQNNYLAASLARDTFNNDGVHICSSKEVVDFVLLFICKFVFI
jgi:hypothetical protein